MGSRRPSGPALDRRELLTALGLCPLASLAGASLLTRPAAAQTWNQRFLSSALRSDGMNAAVLYDLQEGVLFETILPDRAHGPALSPDGSIVVMAARRPGRWAEVIDMGTGQTITRLSSPAKRHFYGHAVFSRDGRHVFTTENHYEKAIGIIGIWETSNWQRIGEWNSGGIGPHELVLSPDGTTLVVGNGGIQTHPDTGREKLNLETMRPNLSYVSVQQGQVLQRAEPPAKWFQCSLRHLDVTQDEDGTLLTIVGAQYEGPEQTVAPLIALHRFGESLSFAPVAPELLQRLNHYCGSVRFTQNAESFAITSPRGGTVVFGSVFEALDNPDELELESFAANDICGLGARNNSILLTTGTGDILSEDMELGFDPYRLEKTRTRLQWDNHLLWV
ncbi:DUF1513 domain-containing protein [Kiloniella sp. b19]|uniref:DUF1513 domain-containing protein n=1 Tax=Kiloniella sp. GXU_MW_B19 TaxID=3141326 RepID=UPI0031D34718